MARIALGDEVAFEALYNRYLRALYGFAASIAGSAEAEAVVQDVFVSLWRVRREVSADPSLRAYLFRAARTRALDNLRGRKRWAARFKSLDLVRDRAAEWRSPEGGELSDAVARVEAMLPARRREAFGLYYRHGLSYAEVGAVMGISWTVVRKYVYLATQTVRAKVPRELLTEYFSET